MKYVIVEPLTKTGKTIIARRGVGGVYRAIAECRLRDVAVQITDALNGKDEKQ